MKPTRHPLALLALVLAALLAGCGGGSGANSGTGSTKAGSAAPAIPANVKEQVAECHRLIQGEKSLPASSKAKLEAACDKAGQGDTAAVKQAAREVCEEVVSRSALPSGGAAREKALAACRK